ncbi:hypothetical protein BKA67DRAFT_542043 [Truncatella angustata]|uniref:Uncharacterized protein n=1 Tax=Truncatella angustata TaxID=152316 RepID=A0A9P8RFS0_9PEZI|nr:uncharacterized protein BKA67DRAFT_542043 [Truncatella angustata]KAH6645057.1 hypothetical protein BKA67DRAFT_542043 [Truncatella angustata]
MCLQRITELTLEIISVWLIWCMKFMFVQDLISDLKEEHVMHAMSSELDFRENQTGSLGRVFLQTVESDSNIESQIYMSKLHVINTSELQRMATRCGNSQDTDSNSLKYYSNHRVANECGGAAVTTIPSNSPEGQYIIEWFAQSMQYMPYQAQGGWKTSLAERFSEYLCHTANKGLLRGFEDERMTHVMALNSECEDGLITELRGLSTTLAVTKNGVAFETVGVFILGPVSGAQVCREHGVSFTYDEVMCCMGHSGKIHSWHGRDDVKEQEALRFRTHEEANSSVEVLNITPDIQMNAKAVGSEFQAVASLMASQRVVQGLQRSLTRVFEKEKKEREGRIERNDLALREDAHNRMEKLIERRVYLPLVRNVEVLGPLLGQKLKAALLGNKHGMEPVNLSEDDKTPNAPFIKKYGNDAAVSSKIVKYGKSHEFKKLDSWPNDKPFTNSDEEEWKKMPAPMVEDGAQTGDHVMIAPFLTTTKIEIYELVEEVTQLFQ